MMIRIGDLTRDEFEAALATRALVIPVGSIEQHGPHLPIGTDSLITEALINELLRLRGEQILLAPAIPFSASDEHASFPGTLSLGSDLLAALLRTIGNRRVAKSLVVSAHGGNLSAFLAVGQPFWVPRTHTLIEAAAKWELPADARGLWQPDAHAGRTETSVMLALRPELVHLEAAAAGYQGALGPVGKILTMDGVQGVSATGVLGDPTGANAEEGLAILAALGADLVHTFDQVII